MFYGEIELLREKKTATAISYKNTYRPHPIYHRRHISLVSSPLLVPSSRFSFMRLVSHLVHRLVFLISFSISPPAAHASSTLSHIDAILPRARSRHPQIRTRTSWIKRRNPIDLPPPSQPEHGKQDATATTSHDDKRTPSPPPTPPTSHTSRHPPRKRHDKTGRMKQADRRNEARSEETTRDANDIERHNEIHDETIRKDETRRNERHGTQQRDAATRRTNEMRNETRDETRNEKKNKTEETKRRHEKHNETSHIY